MFNFETKRFEKSNAALVAARSINDFDDLKAVHTKELYAEIERVWEHITKGSWADVKDKTPEQIQSDNHGRLIILFRLMHVYAKLNNIERTGLIQTLETKLGKPDEAEIDKRTSRLIDTDQELYRNFRNQFINFNTDFLNHDKFVATAKASDAKAITGTAHEKTKFFLKDEKITLNEFKRDGQDSKDNFDSLYAIGASPAEVTTTLLGLINKDDVRKELAREIKEQVIKDITLNAAEQKDRANTPPTAARWLAQGLLSSLVTTHTRIRNQKAIADSKNMPSKEEEDKLESDLMEFCSKPEVFRAYVNTLHTKPLGCISAKLYAEYNSQPFNLYVWELVDKTDPSKGVKLKDRQEERGVTTARHILYSDSLTQFKFLVPVANDKRDQKKPTSASAKDSAATVTTLADLQALHQTAEQLYPADNDPTKEYLQKTTGWKQLTAFRRMLLAKVSLAKLKPATTATTASNLIETTAKLIDEKEILTAHIKKIRAIEIKLSKDEKTNHHAIVSECLTKIKDGLNGITDLKKLFEHLKKHMEDAVSKYSSIKTADQASLTDANSAFRELNDVFNKVRDDSNKVDLKNNIDTHQKLDDNSSYKVEKAMEAFFTLLVQEQLSSQQIIDGLKNLNNWCTQCHYYLTGKVLGADDLALYLQTLLPSDTTTLQAIETVLTDVYDKLPAKIRDAGTGYFLASISGMAGFRARATATFQSDDKAEVLKSLRVKFAKDKSTAKAAHITGNQLVLKQQANLLINNDKIPFEPTATAPIVDNEMEPLPPNRQLELFSHIYKTLADYKKPNGNDDKTSDKKKPDPAAMIVINILEQCANEDLRINITRAYIAAYLFLDEKSSLLAVVKSLTRYAWQIQTQNHGTIIKTIYEFNATLIIDAIFSLTNQFTEAAYVKAIQLLDALGEFGICKTLTGYKASELRADPKLIKQSFSSRQAKVADANSTRETTVVATPPTAAVVHKSWRELQQTAKLEIKLTNLIMSYLINGGNEFTWPVIGHLQANNPNVKAKRFTELLTVYPKDEPTISNPSVIQFFVDNLPKSQSAKDITTFVKKFVDYAHTLFNEGIPFWLDAINAQLVTDNSAAAERKVTVMQRKPSTVALSANPDSQLHTKVTASQIKLPFIAALLRHTLDVMLTIKNQTQFGLEHYKTLAVIEQLIFKICAEIGEQSAHYSLNTIVNKVLAQLETEPTIINKYVDNYLKAWRQSQGYVSVTADELYAMYQVTVQAIAAGTYSKQKETVDKFFANIDLRGRNYIESPIMLKDGTICTCQQLESRLRQLVEAQNKLLTQTKPQTATALIAVANTGGTIAVRSNAGTTGGRPESTAANTNTATATIPTATI